MAGLRAIIQAITLALKAFFVIDAKNKREEFEDEAEAIESDVRSHIDDFGGVRTPVDPSLLPDSKTKL